MDIFHGISTDIQVCFLQSFPDNRYCSFGRITALNYHIADSMADTYELFDTLELNSLF